MKKLFSSCELYWTSDCMSRTEAESCDLLMSLWPYAASLARPSLWEGRYCAEKTTASDSMWGQITDVNVVGFSMSCLRKTRACFLSSPSLPSQQRILDALLFTVINRFPLQHQSGHSRRSLCRWYRQWLNIALVGLGGNFPWIKLAGSVDLSPHIPWGVVHLLGSFVYISHD